MIDAGKLIKAGEKGDFVSDKPYDEILSVSIIDQDGNVLLNTLCKPQKRKSWASAQEIHGISPAMVKNQPTFEDGSKAFQI